MPSFAISKFTVLLETLWVSAEFLLLSTGSLLYIIDYRLGSSTDCTEGSLTRSLGCLLSRAVIKRLRLFRSTPAPAQMKEQWKKEIAQQDKSTIPVITNIENCLQRVANQQTRPGGDI